MTTKIIGINEYRTKLTKLWKESLKDNIRYIVVVHNKPVFEVQPIHNNTINDNFQTELQKLDISQIPSAVVEELNVAVNTPKEDLYNI